VIPVQDGDASLESFWNRFFELTAFRVEVPPGGTARAALDFHHNSEVFLTCYNETMFKAFQTGQYPGTRTISTDASWTNKGRKPETVYFLVTDVEHRSREDYPYTVKFTRDWTPQAHS
jgi:hypothetical protein